LPQGWCGMTSRMRLVEIVRTEKAASTREQDKELER
jgi:hypothetical protein